MEGRLESSDEVCGNPRLYFDTVLNECSACSDICDDLTPDWSAKAENCQQHCPGYVQLVTPQQPSSLTQLQKVNDVTSSWPPILITSMAIVSVVTSVFVILLLVFLTARQKRHKFKSRGVESQPCISRSVSAIDQGNQTPVVVGDRQTSENQPDCLASSLGVDSRLLSFSSITPDETCRVIQPGSHFPVACSIPNTVPKTIASVAYEQGLRVASRHESSISLHEDDCSETTNPLLILRGRAASDSEGKHLISLEFEGRMKMFGWLNSQPWVTQYFEGPDVVEIAVENIDRCEASEKIRLAASNFVSEFDFRIIQPVGGSYVPCPGTSPLSSSAGRSRPREGYLEPRQSQPRDGYLETGQVLLAATNQFCLIPGVQLFSPRMEPADVGCPAVSGYAMYAGCVRGSRFGEYGLTVGHLFDAVGVECQRRAAPWFPVSVTVGKCAFKVDSVDLTKSIRRTTADLALIQLSCPSQNIVRLGRRDYRLRLYRGKLDFRKISAVAIITKDGAIRFGRVNNFLFTIDKLGLYNTMSIVDLERQTKRLNDSGDSGALVTSIPGDADEIYVYGMVIGYYESLDGTRSNTVATRLWDVLEGITDSSSDLDFSGGPVLDDYAAVMGGFCSASIGPKPVVETEAMMESGYVTISNE